MTPEVTPQVTPEDVRTLARHMASSIFLSIELAGEYAIINDSVTEFNHARLMANAPANIVGSADGMVQLRPRHIYRITESETPGIGEISSSWAGMFEETRVGRVAYGREITVAEIRAAAEKYVAIRMSTTQPEA